MKTFVTLFPKAMNIHLRKDVGLIPLVMNTEKGYDSSLACYSNDLYENTENASKLKIKKIKKIFRNEILDSILWLTVNSRKIDVLNLYHFTPKSFACVLFYKLINPRGRIYLKLDMDTEDGEKMLMKSRSIKWFLTKYVLGMCKVVSCETKRMTLHADNHWPIKMHFLPNGVLKEDICLPPTCEKMNNIITVGRLGTRQKATEVLVQAFLNAKPFLLDDVKLILVGPMTIEFSQYLDQVKSKSDYGKDIVVKGSVDNKEELEKMYVENKLFCLPSRWESFGLVLGEALAKGCYIISSNLVSANEITNYGEFGSFFEIDNVYQLSSVIIDKCNNNINVNYERLREWMEINYTWEGFADRLEIMLNE
ncbi:MULTISPECIES: glycosyltransferase [unclassified Breznakia]|uniref:glycosyltransferase family 4 protein n=1 Tax=unclassified Breznakia TaxID=2623764 RepID=UPI002476DFF3|nr:MULTISPECIES: glycosyltransferase [unclassified Breznakia]